MRFLEQWRETAREFDATFGPGAWTTELYLLLGSCGVFAALVWLTTLGGEVL